MVKGFLDSSYENSRGVQYTQDVGWSGNDQRLKQQEEEVILCLFYYDWMNVACCIYHRLSWICTVGIFGRDAFSTCIIIELDLTAACSMAFKIMHTKFLSNIELTQIM